MIPADPRERLIVALDLDGVDQAREMVKRIGDQALFYKIGYQLAFAGGLDLVRELKDAGKKVFLDLKLLDIDNTVEKGVESVLALGVDMLTVHAYPKAMAAAVKAARGSRLCVLGVTVLTSMDDSDLNDAGYSLPARDLVILRARQALAAGMGGIVCSAREVGIVRQETGGLLALVTPGIRPSGAESGDQKRVATPAEAVFAGATHLVVGRPVTANRDPAGVARSIVDEIVQASDQG
jgi:orotidine-5'-phosphate decarboxylase